MKNISQKEFDKIIIDRLKKTKELLLVKGKEYMRNEDPLHNFRRGMEMNRQTPEKVLHGFLTKHLISYMDMLDDMEKGKMPSQAHIDEKLGDIITYFSIQEVLIKNRIKK